VEKRSAFRRIYRQDKVTYGGRRYAFPPYKNCTNVEMDQSITRVFKLLSGLIAELKRRST